MNENRKTKLIVVSAGSCVFLLGMFVAVTGATPPSLREWAPSRSDKRISSEGAEGNVPGGCAFDADCDDHDPCTIDFCADGACVNTLIPKCRPACQTNSDCDDGAPCTEDLCTDGECQNLPIPGCRQPCQTDEDCDDGNGCTLDLCVADYCTYEDIPDCVPCDPDLICPPLDVVFIMDTSGSMKDESDALCDGINQVIDSLLAQGAEVTPHLLGITETPGLAFWCLTDDVVNLLGDAVPGNPGDCPFPGGSAPEESWGPATAIVADRFAWTEGAIRVIVPMSDEGPCNGSIPEGCNDPGDDRDSITNAIAVANDNNVIVSPITGNGASACVVNLASDLADQTGGMAFQTQDPYQEFADNLSAIVMDACEDVPQCDDGNPCTDDYCDDQGVCQFEPNYDAALYCCDPSDGTLTPLDDGDPCTDDVCDPETGEVSHPPAEAGTPCDDGDPCTEPDECDGEGNCVGPEIDCSDDNACTDDYCDDEGVCRHDPNFDEAVYCCDPADGTLTLLDDDNICTDDLCDPETGEVTHVPVEDGTLCDDGNACTDDSCQSGGCVGVPNFDEAVYCCDPLDGTLTEIDDDNLCTDDLCDPATGEVTHLPVEAGTFCDDGDPCTVMDECDEDGNCVGTDITTIPCDSDEDCYGYDCKAETGYCVCEKTHTLCLVAVPSPEANEECYEVGEELIVNVELGYGTAIVVGGQFVIPYDPDKLQFVSIAPGSEYDPSSPFSFEVYRNVDEEAGLIVYSTSIEFTGVGTRGPAVMATIRFLPLLPCTDAELCFTSENPLNTLLIDNLGQPVPYEPDCCTELLRFDDGAPTIHCPESVSANPIPGHLYAIATWDPVALADGCDTEMTLECTGMHSTGIDLQELIEGGGAFPAGLAQFECIGTDSCGYQASCAWEVYVSTMNTLSVDVHLSPTIVDGPLYRCIEFEFFASCMEEPEVEQSTLQFGLPFDLPGHAKDVEFKIPAGQYFCITARDPLHTLRSVAAIDVQENEYIAIFKGDPHFGGNWLVGGNLDGNHVIDMLDFAIYFGQELTSVDPDTPCGTAGPHADVNGDGLVDQLDWSFIQANWLATDKGSCCEEPGSSRTPVPITDISVRELVRMGLGHLSVADLNGDGRVNMDDIAAYMNGVRPPDRTRPERTR